MISNDLRRQIAETRRLIEATPLIIDVAKGDATHSRVLLAGSRRILKEAERLSGNQAGSDGSRSAE